MFFFVWRRLKRQVRWMADTNMFSLPYLFLIFNRENIIIDVREGKKYTTITMDFFNSKKISVARLQHLKGY